MASTTFRRLLLAALVTLPPLFAAAAEAAPQPPPDAYTACQIVVPEYKLSASNIYEAANQTLAMLRKSHPQLASLEIVVGPMDPRPQELQQDLELKNEQLTTILRYWAEKFGFAMRFNGLRVIFDGKPVDNYREEAERQHIHPAPRLTAGQADPASGPMATITKTAKTSPQYLFSKDCDAFGSPFFLCSDWYPLDLVLQNEGATEAVRIISYGGWSGKWSVTVCSGLEKSERYYHTTGYTIHYQYEFTRGGRPVTQIERSVVQPAAAQAFMRQTPFTHPGNFRSTDFDEDIARGSEEPTRIMEVLNKDGYHYLVRNRGHHSEFDDVFDKARDLATSVFRGRLPVAEEEENQPGGPLQNKAPQQPANAPKK